MDRLVTLLVFISYYLLVVNQSVFASGIEPVLILFLISFISFYFFDKNYNNLILLILMMILVVLNLLHGSDAVHSGSYSKSIFIIVFFSLLLSTVRLDYLYFERFLYFSFFLVFIIQIYFFINEVYFGEFLNVRGGKFNGVLVSAFIFDNANSAAAFFLSILILQSLLILKPMKVIVMLSTLVFLLLTFSRTAFVVGVIIFIISSFSYFLRFKFFSIIILSLSSVLVLYNHYDVFDVLVNKFSDAGDSSRLYIWSSIIEGVINEPSKILLGNGASTTSLKLNGVVLSSHSSYVNTFSNMGIFYFIILGLALILKLYYLISNKEKERFFVFFIILTYGITESVLFEGPTAIWFCTIILLCIKFLSLSSENENSKCIS
ncbi:O-antigen ligase family protein [Pseudoalteromonas sp. XMcav11-Q]|uniref:O-antigen ligase family protein n=1 Tax=Pseudoalteromonas sp. XMcav11-Q TaxID=3136665 RepID=UPI0032C4333D